jgi:peptidyl-prolyl cis-trans isomerase D
MLQQMRKLPKWVGFVLFLPLAASFIVWGIADIFRGDTDTSIATVGGTQISEPDLARDLSNLRRRAGAQLTPAKLLAASQRLLQQKISDTALDNEAQRLGLVATDDEVSSTIREIPGFRGPLGAFDQATFRQVIAQFNYTEAGFVAEIRKDLTRAQLTHAGSDAAVLPPGYARGLFSYLNERRAVQYVILPQDAAGVIPAPSDQVLSAYVKSHASAFSTPEYREVTFATIGEEDVEKQIQVSDAQVREAYALRKDTYVIPEKRDIQRINFPNEAAAKAARAKIDAGAKFEDIAKAQGVSPSEFELGSLAEADLANQGPAAFALPVGGITQPLKFTFGTQWSMVRVAGITPGKTTTFDQAKPELTAAIRKELAGSKLEDIVNAFDDDHNTGDDLVQAAKKVGMRVVHIAATDARGFAPDGTRAAVPASPDFLDQVFKSDVGNEGDPFAAADGNRYVLKVDGIIPQKLKSLDAVRAQATSQWIASQRLKILAQKAAELAKRAATASGIAAIAAQYRQPVTTSEALDRSVPSATLNQDFITKVFESPPAKAVFGPTADGKSFIVARISGVFHIPLPLGDPRAQQFVQALGNRVTSDLVEGMGNAARASQGVKINQQQVDHVLGGEGS